MIINMTGGGGTGAILTVASSGAGTVTVSNSTLGKSYSKAVSVGGTAVFKGLASGTWTITLSDGAGAETTQTVVIKADYSTSVAYFNATITITYPAGSTCTATDGVSNFTAPDTSGSWVLTVPNAGTWTVTATANDGSGDTANKAVEITAEGQSVNVELSYRYYLYNNGVAAFDFGWGSGGQGAVSFNDDHILINTNSYPTWITTKAMINRGEFTKLGITCVLSDSPGAGVRFGFSNSNSDIHSNIESKFIASTTITESGEQTAYADLSSVSESAYIVVMSAWDSGTSSVKAIWLE